MEIWKPVVGYEATYEVSNYGNVRRIKLNRGSGFMTPMKCAPNHYGYPRVSLCVNNKSKQRLVHCLVAQAFIGPCPDSMEVNHIDGNKLNPRLDNLEYVTSKGNKDHATAHGLMPFGIRRTNAKLTDEKVREIRKLHKTGKFQREIATAYGVSRRTIGDIVNNRLWLHVK